MVLMHGLGTSTNAFQPLIGHSSPRYTMLRFDFPGSGLSRPGPDIISLSIPQFVGNLESILSSRKNMAELPILVGHSLGSIVAMHYAAKHQVGAIILIGPGRSACNIPAVVERMTALAVKARVGIEGLRDSTVSNNVAASSSDLVKTLVRQMISSKDPNGYAKTCEAIMAPSHFDPDYAAIKCPTLIAGDADTISPFSRSQELKVLLEGKENGREVILKAVHAGHQQILEDTAGVIEAIETILPLA